MVTVQKKPMKDRRVQKTRGLLLEALVSLIHEKSYDSIAVKEILHRANVGRSTFYMHFPGKWDPRHSQRCEASEPTFIGEAS
jgi:AcrR family transcriptional regulator